MDKSRKYSLTFMDLLAAFLTPRHDHPGRKSGCPYRRGAHHGKCTRYPRHKN